MAIKYEITADSSGFVTEIRKIKETVGETTRAVKSSFDEQEKAAKHSFDEQGKGAESLRAKLRALTQELAEATVEYRAMSEAEQRSAKGQELLRKIDQLTQDAGTLRDAMDDANRSIRGVASDTKNWDALAGGINVATSAFGGITGAASLFGAKEEELQDIQTKLQASLAISNALSVIQNNLQKESALMLGIRDIKEKALAMSIAIRTAAEGKGVITTKAATAAQAAFNLVAKANPYVLLATAILTVVGALAALHIGSKRAKESQEELAKAEEEAAQRAKEAREAFVSASAEAMNTASRISSLQTSYMKANSEMEKTQILKEAAKQFKALGLECNNLTDAQRLLVNQGGQVIQMLQLQGEIAALTAMRMKAFEASFSRAIANSKAELGEITDDALTYARWTAEGNDMVIGLDKQILSAQSRLSAIQSKLPMAKSGGGSTKSTRTGSANTGKTTTEAERDAIRERQKREEAVAARELELSTAEATIKAKEEGNEKIIAQIWLDYNKEMLAIEKSQESLRQKRIDEAKKTWDADPKNKDKDFWASDIYKTTSSTYTEAELKNRAEREDAALMERERKLAEAYSEQLAHYRDYLKEYGTIEQQKYAIAQEWEEKIAKAPVEAREKMREDMKKALEDFDINLLRQEIDWETMFEGVGDVLYDEMKASLDKLEQYIKSDKFKSMTPTDQQSLLDMRNNLRQKVGSGVGAFDFSIYSKIGQDLKDYQQAVLDAKEAHRKHKEAVDALTDIEKGLTSVTEEEKEAAKRRVSETAAAVKSADAAVQQRKEDVVIDTTNAQNAIDNFGSALQQMNSKTLKGFADGLVNLINAISGNGKSNGLSGLGKAGGIIGAILQIIDMLGDDAAGFLEGLFSHVGDVIEKLLQQLFTDIVPAVAEGILHLVEGVLNGIGGAIGSIFGFKFDIGSFLTGGNGDEVAEVTKELAKKNEILADRISDLTDVISDAPISKAMYAYKTALDAQNEVNNNAMATLREQMGYHEHHHSNAYYADDYTISKYNTEAQRAFKAAGVTASTLNGLSSIYNLTPEQLKAIKDFAPDLWKYLTEVGKYDKSEYWDAVVEQAGKVEKLTEAINKNLTGTSFDSVFDSFKSSLSDMDKSAYEFSRDFEKYMFDAMLSTEIDAKFRDRIKKWYEDFAKANEDSNISSSEMATLKSQWEDLAREGVELREQLRAVTGYGSSAEGSATYSATQTFTQEQGDVLNGRLSQIQMGVRQEVVIGEQIVENLKSMASVASNTQATNTAVLEIRNMMINTNSYLETVARYSKATYTEVTEKLETITQKVKEL